MLLSNRLNAFIDETVKNYPSDKTRKLYLVSTLITEILEKPETPNYTAQNKVQDAYALIDEFAPNNNASIIEEENSFNLDEVLNPGKDLDLLELCKELGVTD